MSTKIIHTRRAHAISAPMFSDEAQQMVADAYLLPGRSDIQCDGRTNLSDIPQIPTDWTAMMDIADDTAARLNEICQ